MNNFLQDGDCLQLTAPYARESGEGALIGSIFGVAVNDVANAASGVFKTAGCFTLAKTTTDVWAVGQKLYWDNTNKRLDEDSTVGQFVAVALEVTANPSSTGAVKLCGVAENAEGAQAAVADIATADGSDAATTQALANATKAKVNALLAALRLAGVIQA